MPILVPKIVWPSGGANELLFAFPPVNVKPYDQAFRRHDTIASSGERQSLLERVDKFLELDITLVPTEVEQYLTRSEEFDHADWIKAGTPSAPVVTADQVANPLDGAVNADRIVFPATGGGQESLIQRTVIDFPDFINNRLVVGSVFLRAGSGLTVWLKIIVTDGADISIPVVLTTSWQRLGLSLVLDVTATAIDLRIANNASQAAKTIYAWGAQLAYDVLGPYVKSQVTIPAAIDRWDAFIAAVRDGTSFDYYPDAFAGGNTTYVLEGKTWKPKLQVRGANRFYEFKLRLREFV